MSQNREQAWPDRATGRLDILGPREQVNRMELRTWSPFFDLDKDWRFFDLPRMAREMTGFEFRPSIDIVKEGDELLVTAELPGMKAEDIDVSIDSGVLTIKGEKSEQKEISEDDRFMRERVYGRFLRRITLPDGVAADTLKAVYDKGVLTIRMAIPEAQVEEPRHIPIEVNGGGK